VVARALAGPGKKAADEIRTVVWVDQSGVYLLAMAVRTWAPRGQTPFLQAPLTYDHLALQTKPGGPSRRRALSSSLSA
jgi:hypothetical protein